MACRSFYEGVAGGTARKNTTSGRLRGGAAIMVNMPNWPATKANRVLAALLRIGWTVTRQVGSHKRLERTGWAPYTWAFGDGDELGPVMLGRVAKKTGLKPDDL